MMNNQELTQRIRTAAEHAAPDQLDKILSSCDEQKGEIVQMTTYKNKKKGITMIAAAAAVLVLCLGLYAFAGNTRTAAVDAVILLDVNPSLSLSVDSKEKVVAAQALNADAEEVLGDMDLEGTSLEVAVNALIGSMLQKGYLDGSKNSVLVSVESEDSERGTQLELEVSDAVTTAMQSGSVDASVLTQTISTSDEELSTLAETYGISLGKAALIQEVIEQDATLTFEDLASLNISEIAVLISSRNITTDTVTSTGEVSADGYIGSSAALEAALNHAGVSASDITKQEIELDSHKGTIVYEVEFETSSMEYEYHINATTGEIVEYESESKGHEQAAAGSTSNGNTSGSADSTTSNSGNAAGDTSTAGSNTTSTGTYIGEDAAHQIALTNAGVSSSDLKKCEVKLDDDHNRMIYEVEFKTTSKMEYEYEIDATTGEIISVEIDD